MSNKTSEVEIRETEDELVSMAGQAVSRCNWVVGECAAKWTQKFAKGRTDANFGVMVGMNGDQIYQRRRVWETFGDVSTKYSALKWSHFYVALNWDDAPECLQWAQENGSSVAKMKSRRRALHDEKPIEGPPNDEWMGTAAFSFVPTEPALVRDPDSFEFERGEHRPVSGSAPRGGSESPDTVQVVARDADGRDAGYSPFRKGAASPAPQGQPSEVTVAEQPQSSTGQLAKQMTIALERMNQMLTPQLVEEFQDLPVKLRNRFVKAAGNLHSKAAQLR